MGFHLAWPSLNTLFLGGARSLAMSVRVVLSYFNVSEILRPFFWFAAHKYFKKSFCHS